MVFRSERFGSLELSPKGLVRCSSGLAGIAIMVSVAATIVPAGQIEAADSKRTLELLTEAVIVDPHNETIFDAYLATLPRDSRGNYFVEGDLRKTREEVRTYLENLSGEDSTDSPDSIAVPNSELKLSLDPTSGDRSYWAEGQRSLTFSIDTATFGGADAASRITEVREAISMAATEWVNACGDACGLSIEYIEPEEAGEFFEHVTFIVEYDPNPWGPIANAFFPYAPKSDRRLVVFPDFYSARTLEALGLSQLGVMRHELGHVLGYRHEHIEDIAGCLREDDHWVRITDYTPGSVMHYPCGGGGIGDMELADSDKSGHVCVYLHNGPPCPNE